MVHEMGEVEPGAALFENPVDGLDELDDVVRTVEEEAILLWLENFQG